MSSNDESNLSWDEYFMGLACMASKRSKDPSTQVGACIVNKDKRVVALGYNGMPSGCKDDELPWGNTGNWEDTKYPFVCHAEMNAVLNKNCTDLKDCTIYSTLFPCNECSKLIIQAGIKKIIYLSDKHHDRRETKASKHMLTAAGLEYCPLDKARRIVIDFRDYSESVSTRSVTECTNMSPPLE